ncbi:d8667d8a-6595-4468-ba1f-3bd93bb0be6f [Sclerotinia trifoliorum]|uniref:D8667d8a-6595-4468-ba1f-3bd93bb0be6f n=1 Tax=Sclerotinia trifoliorum TaxID=28548 RepID=A0A8H2VYT8_9HELO|nr:d8667d8a-6595-4468-ba1f-3bd93bb0be6f [Sclerotinia trifoliorum]
MSKNLTRSKSVMDRFRGRGAQHVTDDIPPPKMRDTNKFQKFESRREDQHRLPERPSTSGGTKKPKGNALKRANTVKRETRDDLFFNPLRAHGIDGSTFYDFPLPSTRPPSSPIVPKGIDGPDFNTFSLPSTRLPPSPIVPNGIDGPGFNTFPLPSTRPPPSPIVPKGIDEPTLNNFPLPSNRTPPSPVVPKVIEPLPRPKSPDSIKTSETLHPNVCEVEIGMALGSPSHPPEYMQQRDQQSYEVETPSTPHPIDDMSFNADCVDAKKQKKGRKWFGLFGSKKEKTATPFYQVKPESQQEIPMSGPSSPKAERGRSRGRSTSSTTRKKPDMKRAQTAPMPFTTPDLQFPFQASSLSIIHASTLTTIETSDSTSIQASSSTTIQASTSTTIQAGTPDIRVQESIEVEVLQSNPKALLERPKLDLALPTAEMERYSVMFGEILQNPSIITPSLLQRRQATLNRLKSEEEALAKTEAEIEVRTKALSKRRGTSPEPNHNNSSFSLFPNTPSRQGHHENSPARERSQLNRSNTTPAYLSPNRPSFATGLGNDRHADLVSDDETLTCRQGNEHQGTFSSASTKKPSNRSRRSSSSSPKPRPQIHMARTWSPDKSQPFSPSSAEDSEADAGFTNCQRKDVLYSASPLTATKSRFDEKGSTWQMINSKKQNHQGPSSVSGSTTSEASTVSSSHSNSSFSSVPGGLITISMPMPGQENMRETGSMKTSTNDQAPRDPKEMKIPIKYTPGPRPIISSFNTTTRSSDSAPRPPLKSPMLESQGLRPRPSIQRSASTASPVTILPRPPLRISSMASSNNSSTSISTPRKIPLPVSPRPHPHRFIATPVSSPQPEPSYISHQKQESTYSITPSLLDIQIDDHLEVPGARSRDPEQKRLESAAGVSIARQISVSRQQRQLLIPIKTSGTISRKNPCDRSPGLKSPFDRQSERSPISAGFGARRIMTGGDASEKKDSPLENFTGSSLPGGLLSNQNGSDVRGIRIPISHPRGRTEIQQSSKPSTPTLMVVPDVEEQWGTGNSNGLMSSRDKVEAMMKGSRGSPAIGNSEWEEKRMKMNVSPRTEMGSENQK